LQKLKREGGVKPSLSPQP